MENQEVTNNLSLVEKEALALLEKLIPITLSNLAEKYTQKLNEDYLQNESYLQKMLKEQIKKNEELTKQINQKNEYN